MTDWRDIMRWGPLLLLAVAAPVSVSAAGIATGLVLLSALGHALAYRTAGGGLPPRPVLGALGALLACYVLATVLSAPYPHHWHKLLEENWIKLLLVAVPALAAGRPDRVEKLVKLAVLVGVLAAIYAVWQHFSGFDPLRQRSLVRPQWEQVTVTGFFNHHLSYGGQVLIFFLLGCAWLLAGRGRGRLGLAPALGVLGAALLWSYARSAFLGVGCGLLAMALLVPGRRRYAGLGVLAGGLGAALLIPSVRGHLLMLFEMKRHLTRLNLWESSWQGIQARPLLGFGPGNFRGLLDGYQVEGYYETLAHSHNDLLMHGVNAGVPAMLAALAVLVATCLVFRAGWRRAQPGGWVLLGAFAVQVGITVAGFFQVYQTDDEVEILLYFVLGCALAVAGSPGRSEPAGQSGG